MPAENNAPKPNRAQRRQQKKKKTAFPTRQPKPKPPRGPDRGRPFTGNSRHRGNRR